MNLKNTTQGIYHELKGKSNEIIGRISSNKLKQFRGNVERIAGHLQAKCNISFEEAQASAFKMLSNRS